MCEENFLNVFKFICQKRSLSIGIGSCFVFKGGDFDNNIIVSCFLLYIDLDCHFGARGKTFLKTFSLFDTLNFENEVKQCRQLQILSTALCLFLE